MRLFRRALPGARTLRRDRRGVTAVEFALAAPVFFLMVFGGLEVCHALYVRALLQGELDRAARSNSLESALGQTDTIDAKLRKQLQRVAGNLTLSVARSSYRTYSNLGSRPEPFTDTNGDGICNNGEQFEDLNGNGTRNADSGKAGVGGAREIVLYTVTATKPPLVPLTALFMGAGGISFTAQTKLKNQPYTGMSSVATAIC